LEKEGYNIDSILSEVKKRREENEKEIKEADQSNNTMSRVEREKLEEQPVNSQDYPAPEEPKEEKIVIDDETAKEQTESVEEETPNQEQTQPEVEKTSAEEEPSDMVDILKLTEEESSENLDENGENSIEVADENPPKKKKSKGKKTAIAIIIILVILIIGAGVFAYLWANNALQTIQNNSQSTVATTESEWDGMDELVENFEPIQETEATQLSSLQDMIKTWYYNGSPVSSSHVLNVLLVGEDTRGEEILDEDTRADAAIIASINIDTKEITLTSILRDTYAYWETTKGDESTGTFGKINGAMSTGDINAYITCVENLYKIDIDNYVIVNFDSFESIIDALGGVTLELTSAEINEINNHQKRYGNVTIEKTFDGNSGELKLTGAQALAYCRIRKLDSDNARADRQKTCLVEIFDEAKDASNVQLLKIVNSLIPYVKTGFSTNDIVKIAKYAFSDGWLDYDVQMTTVPESRINEKGAGGIYYGAWCWKSDFPQDAYNLQTKIYGKSSITLARLRVDVLQCRETGFFADGNSATTATITNNNYGEVTTLPEEESTTSDEE
jgi:LCP family protein required for cell wall assembly